MTGSGRNHKPFDFGRRQLTTGAGVHDSLIVEHHIMLSVKLNDRHATVMTGIARNRLWHTLISVLNISENMRPTKLVAWPSGRTSVSGQRSAIELFLSYA